MLLWTIQPLEVYELLMEQSVFRCDRSRAWGLKDDELKEAYDWLVDQMNQKIGLPPQGVEYPIWAWHTFCGRRGKPDFRRMGLGIRGEEYLCLEIDVPDQEVLLSEFDLWHMVLNDFFIGEACNEEEWEKENSFYDQLPESEQTKVKEESWAKIFEVDKKFDDMWRRTGEYIQATFWELRLENVRRVWRFKAR